LSKAKQLYDSEADEADADDSGSRGKLIDWLEGLAEKYAKVDLTDLNFEKNADYSRLTAAGEENVLRVDILKNVYEALLEYVMSSGADVLESRAQLFVDLYTRLTDVSALLKASIPLVKSAIYSYC
jgi:hypothetical protein